MKIKKMALILVALLTLSIGSAYAAGSSVTVTTPFISRSQNTIVIHLLCVGDDTVGSVPVKTITAAMIGTKYDYTTIDYHLWEVWTLAGAPAPDAADIAITDRFGFTLFTEASLITASGTKAGTITKSSAITAPLTVTQSNQSTINAEWTIAIKLVRIPAQ
jgi:hypothetical protein